MTSGPSAACAGGATHAASAPAIPTAAAMASARWRLLNILHLRRLLLFHRGYCNGAYCQACPRGFQALAFAVFLDSSTDGLPGMFKLIGIVIAIIPVFLFLRAIFGRSAVMKQAVSE